MTPSMVIAVASLVIAVSTPLAAGASPPVPRCHTWDLRVSIGRFGVGLGNVTTEVAFRNLSSHSCRIYGYAGFGLEGANHRVQPSRVTWGSTYFQRDRGRHRVVLQPGSRAYSNLAWTDNPARSENQFRCEPVSVWLEVTPPDERSFRRVRFGQRVCFHGHLTATALSRSPQGPSGP